MVNLYIISLLIFFSFPANAQRDKVNLVFFQNMQLNELLESIINEHNTCSYEKESVVWYIEAKNNDQWIISKGRIPNLLTISDMDQIEILVTIVNQRVVFILTNRENEEYYDTGFSIDLSRYKDNDPVLFEDFSFWQIRRKNNLYYIADKHIWKCND